MMPQGGLLSNLLMKMMAGILEQHRGSRRLLGGGAEHWPHYDETLVMLFQFDTCTCTCKQSLSCLVKANSVKVVCACRLSFAQQVMCMYCASIYRYWV